jgi:hypothetical protein
MEVTPLLISEIGSDSEIATYVGSRIYGYSIPQAAVVPLILITQVQTIPVTNPQTIWWDSMVTIDIHSNEPAESAAIAHLVMELLPQIVGGPETLVVADSRIDTCETIVDDGWTPIRYRQIVTVDLTAREP